MRRFTRRPASDFDREIDAHIALETDRLIADGMDPAEAYAAARRAFGNRTHARERFRESSAWSALFDSLAQDLGYAVRSFRRQPALAGAVVGAIALAVAANGALFSIFDGLLFRPLPFHEPDRIVFRADLTSPPYLRLELFNELQATPLLTDAATVYVNQTIFQQDTEAATDLDMRAAVVTPNLFTFLGVQRPYLGRLFTDEDLDPYGNCECMMVGFDFWRTHLGGEPSVIGQFIDLPGQRAVAPRRPLLIGVLPPGFDFPQGTKIWVARGAYNVRQPVNSYPPNYLRLAPGATIDHLREAFPRVSFTTLREYVRPKGASALAVLLAATGLLMVVAWVQVASLLFARSAGRASELGVRLALGAGRWRLARQFGTEGIVIATVALALGWMMTPGLVRLLVWQLPSELTFGQIVSPDRRAFAFASALSAVGVLIVGFAPLEVLKRTSPLGLLRGSILGEVGISASRMRTALVIGQLATTTMLLYMSGLALRSFQQVNAADLGFKPEQVLAFRLPNTAIPNPWAPDEVRSYLSGQAARFGQLLPTLRAMPGVLAAGGGRVPLVQDLFNAAGRLRPVRLLSSRDDSTIDALVSRTTSGYVEAIGLRIREGRPPDSSGAMVNMTMARQMAAYGPVIGQRVANDSGSFEVVGIFDDIARSRPDVPADPEVILPWPDQFYSSIIPTIVVRVRGPNEEAQVAAAIHQMLATVFPAEPPRRVIRLADELRRATGDHRARSTILGLIALLCLPLASAGVAGALLHAVRQQAREIGIRIALGAGANDIRRRVLGHALMCVAAGLAVGLITALAIGRWMATYLYGVRAVDAWSIAGVVIVLLAVALVSAWWPAHRASTIDPSVVLREG